MQKQHHTLARNIKYYHQINHWSNLATSPTHKMTTFAGREYQPNLYTCFWYVTLQTVRHFG